MSFPKHLVALICIFVVLVFTQESLFSSNKTLAHDNYYWLLPMFSHWIDSITSGRIPYFDFFSNLGVPFTTNIVMGQFIDPFQLSLQLMLRPLFQDNIALFNAVRLSILVINLYFVFLLASRFVQSRASLVLLCTTIFFSSFFLVSLRQNGFLGVFQWVPISAYFLIQYFEQGKKVRDLMAAILFAAPLFQAYFFSGLMLMCLFAALAHIEKLRSLFSIHLGLLLILAIPCLPTVSLLFTGADFVFPAREPQIQVIDGLKSYAYSQYMPKSENLIQSDIFQNYEVLRQVGVFGKIEDFITLFSSSFNSNVVSGFAHATMVLNEGHFFYGTLATLFLPIGFAYFVLHRSRISAVFVMMLMFYLGPSLLFHEFIYKVLPPIWVFRHSALLNMFIQCGLVLFLSKGFDLLWNFQSRENNIRTKQLLPSWAILSGLSLSILGLFLVGWYFDPSINLLGLNLIHTSIIFALLLMGSIFFAKLQVVRKPLLGVILTLNIAQLCEEFSFAQGFYSQDLQIEQSKPSETGDDLLRAVAQEKASVHSGCYYGNTSQALRYPGLIKKERSIFSPPAVAAGVNPLANGFEFCERIDRVAEIQTINTWNVIQVYRSYWQELNDNTFDIRAREYIFPSPLHRKLVTGVETNRLILKKIKPGLIETSLYHDPNWRIICDEEKLALEDGRSVSFVADDGCEVLTIEYYPQLFIWCLSLVCIFYLVVGAFVLFPRQSMR